MDIHTIAYAIAIVVGLILVIVLKPDLELSGIEIPLPSGGSIKLGKIKVKLNEKLDKNTTIFKDAGISIQFNPNDYTSDDKSSSASNRDAVIEKSASLAQSLKALARAKNIPFSESLDVSMIVGRLVASNVISTELAGAAQFLYGVGTEVRNKPKDKIDSLFSRKYGFFVDAVVEVINKLLVPTSGPIEPSPPRKTQVGGAMLGFAHPERGRPAADLYCRAGAFQGQRFPIDKPVYRLGANTRNDLVISGDDYVSGSHAYISYDQGSLILFDDGSRNGTFLTGERLKSPMLLKLGDKIRLGGCTFELT